MNNATLQKKIQEIEAKLNNENHVIDDGMNSIKEQISRHRSILPCLIFGGFLFGALTASRKRPFKFLFTSLLTTSKVYNLSKKYSKYFHLLHR